MNTLLAIFQTEHNIEIFLRISAYVLLAPFAGGLLAGIDRKITAWMQGRVGPPIVQPFYDVIKLFRKEYIVVNRFQNFYLLLFLLFMVFTGSLFFMGADILLVIFALTLSTVFFALAGFSVNSPFAHIGAEREVIQIMAYDPMVIIMAIGMYLVTGSFSVETIFSFGYSDYLIFYLPGIFIGYIFILTIKFRKSPFDVALSHHAHQELVKGLTTEFSGKYLAVIEITHWYENVILLGIVYLFFSFNPLVGAAMVALVYFLEIYIDNSFARFKYKRMFVSTWVCTIITGVTNIIVLYYVLPKK